MSFDYNKTINTLEESNLYEHHTLENIIVNELEGLSGEF